MLEHVKKGDPISKTLIHSADSHNAVIDTAIAYRQGRLGQQAGQVGSGQPHQTIVPIKNASASAVSRFGILGINSPIFTPSDAPDTFANQLGLSCDTPAAADHSGKFVIALEPIAAGKIGRGLLVGICWVQVNIADNLHSCCDVADGQSSYLASAVSGAGQILWKPAGTGTEWCLVRLGTAPPGELIRAKITGHAYADGTGTNPHQWTYSWVEVEKTAAGYGGWSTLSGGRSGTNNAYNDLEDINTAADGPQGNSVDASGPDYPEGFDLQPVPTGTPVRLRPVSFEVSGTVYTEYWFVGPSMDDGTCEAT